MSKKIVMGIASLLFVLMLSACNTDNQKTTPDKSTDSNKNMEMDHSKMNHSSSGEVPKGLKVAENPTYKVGSHVIIKGSHMEGMNGATATIVGAYDTTVYVVSYTPTTGGEPVKNHKWVTESELLDK